MKTNSDLFMNGNSLYINVNLYMNFNIDIDLNIYIKINISPISINLCQNNY